MKTTPLAPQEEGTPPIDEAKYQRLKEDVELVHNLTSHSLKSPLNTILIYCGELEERLASHALLEEQNWLHVVRHETERMREMVVALFDYLSIEITSHAPLLPVNTEKILAMVQDNMKSTIQELEATITHDPLPVILGREKYIASLFKHLIENALTYRSEKPPLIHISVVQEGSRWRFSIKDNGRGIPEEFEDIIFILFQRINPVDKYPGLGVGLALCKKIVETTGGEIYVMSEPGEGSTFFFTLPAVTP